MNFYFDDSLYGESASANVSGLFYSNFTGTFEQNKLYMYSKQITENFLAELAATLKMKLTREQGNAVRLIAIECDNQGVSDVRQVSYILATVYHECRFKSIKEIRAKPGTVVFKMQEKYWHTGYYGRGFSQLTWKKNYQKFSPIVGLDLVSKPDLALKPEVGAKIIVHGMRKGLFTGVSLDNYFSVTRTDWFNARRIVNHIFKAQMVADAAINILPLLNAI